MTAHASLLPPPSSSPNASAMALHSSATASSTPANNLPAVLRGTGRGLEALVAPGASIDEIELALEERLEQSPGFFAGNDVIVRLNGARLPAGGLARLDALFARYGLRTAEVRANEAPSRAPIVSSAPAPSAPEPAKPQADLAEIPGSGAARFHVGPVRSGVVLAVPGDLVVLGDVNPGAEIRAGGTITVMGSLRGVAHANFENDARGGFIVALRLDAPLVKIGTLIARADGKGARGAEIAFATAERQIAVEPYAGRLPAGMK